MPVKFGETYWKEDTERFLFAGNYRQPADRPEDRQTGREKQRKTPSRYFMQVQPVLALAL